MVIEYESECTFLFFFLSVVSVCATSGYRPKPPERGLEAERERTRGKDLNGDVRVAGRGGATWRDAIAPTNARKAVM